MSLSSEVGPSDQVSPYGPQFTVQACLKEGPVIGARSEAGRFDSMDELGQLSTPSLWCINPMHTISEEGLGAVL